MLSKNIHIWTHIDSTILPLGRIQINNLKELTKVGSVLNKDYCEPSIFDLDDLQTVPKHFAHASKYATQGLTSSSSTSSLSSSESPTFSQSMRKTEQYDESANDFRFKVSEANFSDDDVDNEDDKFKEKMFASNNRTKLIY